MRSSHKQTLGIVALAAALTACGGVATQGEEGGDQGPVEELKIGAPYPLSGTWAVFGQNAVAGMEAAANVINEGGGIECLGGATVRIASADTSDDPAQARSVTSKLIQDEKVSAVVGSYLSSLSLTTSTAAEQARVPFLTQSFVDELTARGYEYILQLPPKSSAFGRNAVTFYLEIAESQGGTVQNAAIVSSNDAAGKAQAQAVADEAAKNGITAPAPVLYAPGISDVAPIVRAVQDAQPDVIFSYGPVEDTTLIVDNLRSRGVDAPIIGTGGTGLLDKGIAATLGERAEGLLSLSAWNDDMDLPGVDEARNAFMAANPNEPFMPQEAGESFVAVMEIAEAAEQACSADPQRIRDTLAGTEFTGAAAAAMPPGVVDFDETGMNSHATPIVIQWQGGRPVTVWPREVAAAPVK